MTLHTLYYCAEGWRLYDAYTVERLAVEAKGYYTDDPDQPILATWHALQAHVASCEKCKVVK